MTHYDWVIAAITVGSLTGAILAGAYAIEQRSQRQAQQRRAEEAAEEAEMWLMLADSDCTATPGLTGCAVAAPDAIVTRRSAATALRFLFDYEFPA